MRLQELALASARVAAANDKASDDLSALLEKWFAKHLIKGIKLPVLRSIQNAGALGAFSECLAERDEADVIAVLRKLDPHKGDILNRSRSEIEAHIRALATGQVEPAEKPKPAKKVKALKDPPAKSRTGGVYERSRVG